MEFFEKAHEILTPILPKKFDENEWFTIFATILVFWLFFFLHKRSRVLMKTEIIAILLFNLLYTTVGDYFLAMEPYDFYDTVDRNSAELMDVLLQNIVYPFTLLIFMNYYAKNKPNSLLFILVGSGILFGLEWVGMKFFNLYTFKTWKSWYSLVFYIPVMYLNVIYYQKFHRYIHQQIKLNSLQ
ncbi:MAG: CBO0543 family protein [Neobacillus sp.]